MEKAYEKIKEKKDRLNLLKQLRNAMKRGDLPSAMDAPLAQLQSEKGAPKTLDQCTNQINKLSERVTKEEFKAQNREDNKTVALGTSKINYMDPRITIGWCKLKEVPIEKVFQATLRNKFAWAMDSEPGWKF